jgi:hypothetical protein
MHHNSKLEIIKSILLNSTIAKLSRSLSIINERSILTEKSDDKDDDKGLDQVTSIYNSSFSKKIFDQFIESKKSLGMLNFIIISILACILILLLF